ncbi:MAG: FkbM family methyltransferase [Bacillota bacterium]
MVQVFTLDTLIFWVYRGSVDVYKSLDIEGGEYQAFKGMARLIENRAVGTIAFELNKQRLKNDWLPFYKLLKEIKAGCMAKFFTLTPEGETVPSELDSLFESGSPCVIMKF